MKNALVGLLCFWIWAYEARQTSTFMQGINYTWTQTPHRFNRLGFVPGYTKGSWNTSISSEANFYVQGGSFYKPDTLTYDIRMRAIASPSQVGFYEGTYGPKKATGHYNFKHSPHHGTEDPPAAIHTFVTLNLTEIGLNGYETYHVAPRGFYISLYKHSPTSATVLGLTAGIGEIYYEKGSDKLAFEINFNFSPAPEPTRPKEGLNTYEAEFIMPYSVFGINNGTVHTGWHNYGYKYKAGIYPKDRPPRKYAKMALFGTPLMAAAVPTLQSWKFTLPSTFTYPGFDIYAWGAYLDDFQYNGRTGRATVDAIGWLSNEGAAARKLNVNVNMTVSLVQFKNPLEHNSLCYAAGAVQGKIEPHKVKAVCKL